MRCLGSCLGNCIGLFLVFVIMVTVPMAAGLFAFWSIFLDPAIYTDNIDDNMYDDLSVYFIPAFADALSEAKQEEKTREKTLFLARTIENLDRDDWQEIVEDTDLVSTEWLREQVESNSTTVFAYLEYQEERLRLSINMQPLLESIQRVSISEAINQLMFRWENCTPAQDEEFNDFIANTTDEFPECKPAPETHRHFLLAIEESQNIMIGSILTLPRDPAGNHTLDLRYEGHLDGNSYADVDKTLNDIRRTYRFIDRTIIVLFLLPLMVFGLLTLLKVRSLKDFFIWTGLSLMGSGFLTALPTIPWLFNLLKVSQGDFSAFNVNVNEATATFFFTIESWIAGLFAPPLIISAGIFMVIGFVALALGALMRSEDQEPEQPQVVYMMPQTGYMPTGSSPVPLYPMPSQSSTPPSPAPLRKRSAERTPPPAPTPPPKPTPPPAPAPRNLSSSGSTPASGSYMPASGEEKTFIESDTRSQMEDPNKKSGSTPNNRTEE